MSRLRSRLYRWLESGGSKSSDGRLGGMGSWISPWKMDTILFNVCVVVVVVDLLWIDGFVYHVIVLQVMSQKYGYSRFGV